MKSTGDNSGAFLISLWSAFLVLKFGKGNGFLKIVRDVCRVGEILLFEVSFK